MLREDDEEHAVCLSEPNQLVYHPLTANGTMSMKGCTHHVTIFMDDMNRVVYPCIPPPPSALELQRDVATGGGGGSSGGSSSSGALAVSSVRQLVGSTDAESTKRNGESSSMRIAKRTDLHDAPAKTPAARSCGIDKASRAGATSIPSSGLGEYSGEEMDCVRSHCPAEILGMLRLGACQRCGGKEVLIRVPQAPVPTSAGGAAVVTVPCPVGYHGELNRTCTHSGWVEDSPLAGGCARKFCPATLFKLEGWTSTMSPAVQTRHQVSVPDTTEGTGRVVLRCPEGYQGQMSVRCGANADAWTEREDCKLLRAAGV